jgi:hypothetical protein
VAILITLSEHCRKSSFFRKSGSFFVCRYLNLTLLA